MYEKTMVGEEDKGKWMGIISSSVIAGIIIAVLPETIEWFLEVDFSNPQNVPSSWATMWTQASTALKFVGGVMVVVGGIVGVIKLEWVKDSMCGAFKTQFTLF